ncbi:MAG TPA: DUF1499 domain-containing protein [Usitatibacter sp.]|nr:DUF1499 domain-containing protein [Usitatibacter sp.]
MHLAKILVLVVAVAALAMMVAAGPGTRFDVWTYRTGLSMLAWSTWTGIAAVVLAVILLGVSSVPRWHSSRALPFAALVLALVAIAPPLILLGKAKSVPPIHDITTDTADPPAFVALMPARAAAPNGAAYGGEAVAKQQREAYPDIKPLTTKEGVAEATQRASDLARALGWDVVATDMAAGRVEATATTGWFGFKDDVVVRVRPEGSGGSRLDVRSVSRVGRSDIGANAARVREFLSRLA